MTNDAMIGALRSYMAHNDHVSFAELTNRIPGANGDRAYGVLDLNVCFWPGLSPELWTFAGAGLGFPVALIRC